MAARTGTLKMVLSNGTSGVPAHCFMSFPWPQILQMSVHSELPMFFAAAIYNFVLLSLLQSQEKEREKTPKGILVHMKHTNIFKTYTTFTENYYHAALIDSNVNHCLLCKTQLGVHTQCPWEEKHSNTEKVAWHYLKPAPPPPYCCAKAMAS